MPNFSGKWNLDGQLRGIKQGTWTGILVSQIELYSWGANSEGSVGDNTNINKSSPVQIGSDLDWTDIDGKGEKSNGIRGGRLFGWGRNAKGKAGFAQIGGYNFSSPIQIGSLTTWTSVHGGWENGFGIRNDNTLWVWGNGTSGAIGDNTQGINRSSPIQVGVDDGWIKAEGTAGPAVAAITTNNELYVWGNNQFGQLGLNESNLAGDRSSPTQVGVSSDWVDVSAGTSHFISLKTDGTLWTWGRNNEGQLGLNDTVDRSSPVQVGLLTTWANISGARECSFAVKTDGTLWAWGTGTSGRLGDGTIIDKSSPVQIGALTNWSTEPKTLMGSHRAHSGAVKTDTTLWTWGEGVFGSIGDNTGIKRSSPVQVGSLSTWTKVAGAGYTVLALNDTSYRTGMS